MSPKLQEALCSTLRNENGFYLCCVSLYCSFCVCLGTSFFQNVKVLLVLEAEEVLGMQTAASCKRFIHRISPKHILIFTAEKKSMMPFLFGSDIITVDMPVSLKQS